MIIHNTDRLYIYHNHPQGNNKEIILTYQVFTIHDVVPRYRDTQLQPGEITSYLFNLGPNNIGVSTFISFQITVIYPVIKKNKKRFYLGLALIGRSPTRIPNYTVVQSQKSAHFSCKQMLHFGFAEQYLSKHDTSTQCLTNVGPTS